MNITLPLLLATLIIAGCATQPKQLAQDSAALAPTFGATRFQGKTLAVGTFKNSVMALAVPFAQMQAKCSSPIELIETELFSIPEQPVFANGVAVSGEVVERWTASLCGKKQIMYVTYAGTPQGKTNISVSAQPVKKGLLQSLPEVKN